METARVLIVEDEVIVSRDIELSLRRMNCTVVGKAATGASAVTQALAQSPDLVLMDIHLKGGMNGIEAAYTIRRQLDVPIVFLTANSDQATVGRARVIEPYGYVLKTFTDAGLQTAVTMALHRHDSVAELKKERDHLYHVAASGGREPLFVRSSGRMVRLYMEDIQYVESMLDYLDIHMKGVRYTIHSTMKDFEARLPPDDFARIHRSYLVRLDKVEAIEGQNVILDSGMGILPIGSTYYNDVRQRMRSL